MSRFSNYDPNSLSWKELSEIMGRQMGGGLFSDAAPEPEPEETGQNSDALDIVNRQRLAGEAAQAREDNALRENAGRMDELRKLGIDVQTAQPMPMGPAPTYRDVPAADDHDALKKYGENQLQAAEEAGRAGIRAMGFDDTLLRRAQPTDPGLGVAGPVGQPWYERMENQPVRNAAQQRLSGPAKVINVGGVEVPVYGFPPEPEPLGYVTKNYSLRMSIEFTGRQDERQLASAIRGLGKVQMGGLNMASTIGFGPGEDTAPKRGSFTVSVASDRVEALFELLKAGESIAAVFPNAKITGFELKGF